MLSESISWNVIVWMMMVQRWSIPTKSMRRISQFIHKLTYIMPASCGLLPKELVSLSQQYPADSEGSKEQDWKEWTFEEEMPQYNKAASGENGLPSAPSSISIPLDTARVQGGLRI